ncbi:interferon-induced protein with tetratricopeptide repeats 5-like isoform X2 [Phyllobates terribilis]
MKIQHSTCTNLWTLYNLKAYLLHLQQKSGEALQCLQEAEKLVARAHESLFDHRLITIYGNYAWIYYLLNNFRECEEYLQKVNDLCSRHSESILHSSEMFAEQGWSFLEVGIRNGQWATKYFTKALAISPDFGSSVGLAYSIYAHAVYTQDLEVINQAIGLLDEIVLRDPENWEARVYLADMLQATGLRKDKNRARRLVVDDFQGCTNPEVLRILAGLYQIITFEKSFQILQRAKGMAPNYHKLTHEMGNVYRHRAYRLRSEEESLAVAEASRWYTLAIQLMPWNVDARLDLANMYGKKYQAEYEGEIYAQLSDEVEHLSKSCKQRFFLQYGIYFLYKIQQTSRGIEMLKSGFKMKPTSKWGVKCKKGLTFCTILYSSTEEEIDGFINEVEDAKRLKLLK